MRNSVRTKNVKCIDSVRFMASSLSNIADNLIERLHKGKYKDFKSSLIYGRQKN